jgi:hypothetical protein
LAVAEGAAEDCGDFLPGLLCRFFALRLTFVVIAVVVVIYALLK